MRNLYDVLVAIIPELPDSEAALRQRLESIQQSILYTAPEAQYSWWRAAQSVLGDRVAELMSDTATPFPEWPEKTRRIFAGEPAQ